MNDASAADAYERAAERLLEIAAQLRQHDRHGKNLAERIRDAQVGHLRSPSMEPGSGSTVVENLPDELRGSLSYSDPTGTAGLQAATKGDRARDSLARLYREAAGLDKRTLVLHDDLLSYNPRPANVIEQQEKAEPGCESCSRVPSPGTVAMPKAMRTPFWNAIARENVTVGTKTYALCEWCRVQVRQTGELPEVTNVESYRDTGRAKRRSA